LVYCAEEKGLVINIFLSEIKTFFSFSFNLLVVRTFLT